jgi:membrane protease YdiL (CAAX protease family)
MFNGSVATLMQHVLFLFLLVVAPIWDSYSIGKLKRHPGSERKIRYYKQLCIWLWIATALAVVVVGFRPLFTISPSPGEISWLLQHPWVRYLVETLIAIAFILMVALPVGVVIWKKMTKRPLKYSSAVLKEFAYFFPATWTERRWWAFLSITAGVCEEALFRGFMLRYLHVFPWTLPLTLALLISCVIFALHHLYQGAGGAVGVAIVGLVFGLLFVLTGNLLFPILFHGATDLRTLVVFATAHGSTTRPGASRDVYRVDASSPVWSSNLLRSKFKTKRPGACAFRAFVIYSRDEKR